MEGVEGMERGDRRGYDSRPRGTWVNCGMWVRQEVLDGEYDYSHLAAQHGSRKVLILGASFAHI